MIKIIKWLMILSPYFLPFVPLIFIDSSWPYWIGLAWGAAWMFHTLVVGDIFRKARLSDREPMI